MHLHYIEDERGDLVGLVTFCSGPCHREWCERSGNAYGGWNGCHEGEDCPEFCANCGVFCGGIPDCDCQRDNVVMNRFLSEYGELCEHGHWVQLPARLVGANL